MQAKYKNLKHHIACESLPELTPDKFAKLKADIKTAGRVHVPIALTPEGLILDGRHRYRAATELGDEGERIVISFTTVKEDPYAYVQRVQEARREMTPVQWLAWGYLHERHVKPGACSTRDTAKVIKLSSHRDAKLYLKAILDGDDETLDKVYAAVFPPAKKVAVEPSPLTPVRDYIETPSTFRNVMHVFPEATAQTGEGRDHFIIPDTQVKPGVPLVHFKWLAKYVAHKRPAVIMHLGDHFDMPSLSSYDLGTASSEGKRLKNDVAAGRLALRIFNDTLKAELKGGVYEPEMHMLTGNHEERILRHTNANPALVDEISLEKLGREEFGWTTHGFLKPVTIDGVKYSHYFCANAHGRVVQSKRGQPSAREQVKRIGQSAVAGHTQGLDVHWHSFPEKIQVGIVAGSCYLHDEAYLTDQGHQYWRGALMLKGVKGGQFSPWAIDLDYFCRRYEGKSLADFISTAKDSELMIANV